MAIFTGIMEFLKSLFAALTLASKYVPPKTPEDRVEDGQKEVADRIEKEKSTGRPS